MPADGTGRKCATSESPEPVFTTSVEADTEALNLSACLRPCIEEVPAPYRDLLRLLQGQSVRVRRLEEQGVTDVIVGFRWPYATGPDTEPLAQKIGHLRRFADDVIAKVQASSDPD